MDGVCTVGVDLFWRSGKGNRGEKIGAAGSIIESALLYWPTLISFLPHYHTMR
jgi:hypothetical protein